MIVMTKIYLYPLPTLNLLMMYMNSCLIFVCSFASLSYKYSVSTTIDSFGDMYPIPGMGYVVMLQPQHVFNLRLFDCLYFSHTYYY